MPAVLAERNHAFAHGELAQFWAAAAALDSLLEAGGHNDDFKKRGAAGIAALPAVFASDRPADLVRPLHGKSHLCHFFRFAVGGLGAMFAEAADEALGDEGPHG